MLDNLLVIGSSNTDMVIKTDVFPRPGETVLGGKFLMNPGGKGANQAVAAARMGARVALITKTGNDIFGRQAVQGFEKEGIDTSGVLIDETLPSGIALITVDGKGENSIVVASGANAALLESDLFKCESAIRGAGLLLLQLEIPLITVLMACKMGKESGKKVILNPAPACVLPDEIFPTLFLIVPNETEAEILTGIKVNTTDDAKKAGYILLQKGVQNVVITLGSKGAVLVNHDQVLLIPSPKVEAIDTTAAGDVFNGALAMGILENLSMENAVALACQAASLSVTRMGAQASAPFRREIRP